MRDYFLRGRPLLLRNVVGLAERCALAAGASGMRPTAENRQFSCGATGYPDLTGRSRCGTFTFRQLAAASSPQSRCTDGTRPVCNLKMGERQGHTKDLRPLNVRRADARAGAHLRGGVDGAVNTTVPFKSMPPIVRQHSTLPPIAALTAAWGEDTARTLWAGADGSGSGLHYHNPAYNLLFFGTKQVCRQARTRTWTRAVRARCARAVRARERVPVTRDRAPTCPLHSGRSRRRATPASPTTAPTRGRVMTRRPRRSCRHGCHCGSRSTQAIS